MSDEEVNKIINDSENDKSYLTLICKKEYILMNNNIKGNRVYCNPDKPVACFKPNFEYMARKKVFPCLEIGGIPLVEYYVWNQKGLVFNFYEKEKNEFFMSEEQYIRLKKIKKIDRLKIKKLVK